MNSSIVPKYLALFSFLVPILLKKKNTIETSFLMLLSLEFTKEGRFSSKTVNKDEN